MPAALSFGMLLLAAAAVAWAVAHRIGVDYDNEVIESQIALMTGRVVKGLPLYTAPTPHYIADNYPPLFFWVCGLLSRLGGSPLMVGRWVSVVSTLLAAAALPFVERRTPLGLRLILPLAFIAYYYAAIEWFDLNRIDMLATALFAWAAVAAMRGRGRNSGLLAAVLCFLTLLAKHNFVFLVGGLGLAVGVKRPSRGAGIGLGAGAAAAAMFALLHQMSEGWSTHYLFLQPMQHGIRWMLVFLFLRDDLRAYAMLVMLAILAACGSALARSPRWQGKLRAVAPLLLLAGGLFTACSGRFKMGGSENNLIPFWLAALMALALAVGPRIRNANERGPAALFWWSCAAACLSLVGTFAGFWEQRAWYRNEGNRIRNVAEFHAAARRLLTLGPVWIPMHAGCSALPDAQPGAHSMTITFLRDTPYRAARTEFLASLDQFLSGPDHPAVVLSDSWTQRQIGRNLQKAGYVDGGTLLGPDSDWAPRRGGQFAPNIIMVRSELVTALQAMKASPGKAKAALAPDLRGGGA